MCERRSGVITLVELTLADEASRTGPRLVEALGRFIYSGGTVWESGWKFAWPFLLFLLALGYNVARFALLRKTMTLEWEQTVTGVPPRFVFYEQQSWWFCYLFVQYFFKINIAIVIVHTIVFLWQRIVPPT